MPLPPRLFPGDEELGKRDDDHRPGGKKNPLGLAWQHRRMGVSHGPHKRTLKRIALGILALIALYYFFKNMPTDLENPSNRPHYIPNTGSAPPAKRPHPVPGSKPSKEDAPVLHDFNGPIKFYQLAHTLHSVYQTGGSALVNSNVLFAAASLKSAAVLLPIACDMAIRGRNYVHFALMGRDDIAMDILKSVNGITKECKIMFHDARPDFSLQSSNFRMEVSVSAGFNHINTFVHPQATFVDSSEGEEVWFMKGLKERAAILGRTVIELPENAEQNLMWLTLLDSASLSAWNKVSVNILVHAQPSASGSLIRLLQSLKKADFFSSTPPRLTIELPHDIEEPTRRYLESFQWPSVNHHKTGNLLTLHHRIPQHGLTPEENSIRMLESFWPADPSASHVLVLSPQVELSPLFFHYLKYTILEYKYSLNKAALQLNLLGISLDLPSMHLDEASKFVPPLINATVGANVVSKGVTPFLWQSPNSNAALYFGDKWIELHEFVTNTLTSKHRLPTPATLTDAVSKKHPSWLEHILKLARARGYWTIYPNFENQDTLATVHTDLYQAPEEFAEEVDAQATDSDVLTADPAKHKSPHSEQKLLTTSLLNILPFEGELPKIFGLPLITWDGHRIDAAEAGPLAVEYSKVFRREIGGCDEDSIEKTRVGMSVSDLFCLNDPKT